MQWMRGWRDLLSSARARQISCFSPTEKFSPSASTTIISWFPSADTCNHDQDIFIILIPSYLLLEVCPFQGPPHLLIRVLVKRVNVVPGFGGPGGSGCEGT